MLYLETADYLILSSPVSPSSCPHSTINHQPSTINHRRPASKHNNKDDVDEKYTLGAC